MKRYIYIIAILSLPLTAFCQFQEGSYSTYSSYTTYATDGKTNGKVVQIAGNPGNGQFNILFAKNHDVYTSLIAYDNAGRIVYQKEHLNGNPVSLDLSHLQAGIYFLVFMANNRMERITQRVAIVK